MFGFSLGELLLVGVIGLIVFGPEKLPEIARMIGGLSSQLKKGSDSIRREFYNSVYKPMDEASLTAQKSLRAIAIPTGKDLLAGLIATPPPPPQKPVALQSAPVQVSEQAPIAIDQQGMSPQPITEEKPQPSTKQGTTGSA